MNLSLTDNGQKDIMDIVVDGNVGQQVLRF